MHLRLCMECGHVGCCDNSKNKHATAHFHQTQHPIMKSFEPGEDWGWCFVDEVEVDERWPIRGMKVHTRAADRENERLYERPLARKHPIRLTTKEAPRSSQRLFPLCVESRLHDRKVDECLGGLLSVPELKRHVPLI